MKVHALVLGGLLAAISVPSLHAGCCAAHDAATQHAEAQAIGEYRITSREDVTDATSGRIFTHYTAQLNATLKGEAPAQLDFRTPGGRRGEVVEISSLNLDLTIGEDYILHLRQGADESWAPVPFETRLNRGTPVQKKALRNYFQNGASGRMPVATSDLSVGRDQGTSGVPGSVVTATGYSEDGGYPSRFTICDGGLPIPYVVDIDPAKLPPGMNSQGALDAVSEALGVWTAASSVKFRYVGTASFGKSADSVTTYDGVLRIQLHDSYGVVNSPAIGIGGGYFTTNANVRQGGTVAGQGFQERLNAYVVLEHNTAFMNDIANFKQVLTHELGHALGLAHSSENPSEPNAILKNATMYYSAANDGRGAALTVYDQDRIAFGYPTTNTPPYVADRYMPAVSDSGSGDLPVALGVNRIETSGIDLQGDTLTPSMPWASDVTKWSLSGSQLVYTPAGFLGAARLTDAQIEAGSFRSLAYFQVSDGTNLSRAARCTVIQIDTDSKPTDGLPNNWLTTYFGNINAVAEGDPSHPLSDPDGDGLNNREEYNLGSNPLDGGSPAQWVSYDPAQSKVTVTPSRFATLQLQESTDLRTWTTRCITCTASAVPLPITLDATPPSEDSKMKVYRVIPLP
ncbi:matrixin family metalloprotease [Haloferula sp. BvORR071]|uniref:matrixin family metalloprotease n=1 Tax=Haloferula sp. BvORR071 TaxID=1396141 RepID=UPI00054F7360|nr:matrixin family metalloprotease [Haloferula sp. BvORR071]